MWPNLCEWAGFLWDLSIQIAAQACVIQAMSVHDFIACQSCISRHVGPVQFVR
jgi:hypothetical protein